AKIGVDLAGGDTTVVGNYIGLNALGTAAVPNLQGVVVHNSGTEGIIGGAVPGAGNTVSGNQTFGIAVDNVTKAGFRIQGNSIGTSRAGAAGLGGHNVAGVWVTDSRGVVIGGTAAGAGNVISGNWQDGVILIRGRDNVVAGNKIGTNTLGTAAVGNGRYG